MYAWIRNSLLTHGADSYEDIVRNGSALTSHFDLTTIPHNPSGNDALVAQRLAVAEVNQGVVYHGVPRRLLNMPEDQRPSGIGQSLGIENFLRDGEPSIS